MATTPTSSISGVVSGINYRDLVDQIMAVEKQPADRLRTQASQLADVQSAIATYKGLLQTLQQKAQALRDGSAFNSFSATSAIIAGTRVLASASASIFASPGTYQIEVTTLAQQQKLGSTAQAGTTVPVGVSGEISLNGKTVTLLATDSLRDIRDRINAANTGSTASGISASIITTSAGQSRLVLTSVKAGTTGMTLADTSGTALQSLGILSAPTTTAAGAVLVPGQDAQFSVDGVPFITSSNVVTTAIEGVTLTLTSAEAGAKTSITVGRSAADAQTAMQGFVDAYNAVVDFIKQQQTAAKAGGTNPPLYGDGLLRLPKSSLPQTLLTSISGSADDLSTAAMAGLSLGRDGKLSLVASKFSTVFPDRVSDLQKLFQASGTSTGSTTRYLSSTSLTPAGTYPVVITQAATQTQVAGSGLGGTYAGDGNDDIMTVTDTATKKSISVTLTDGMTDADIVSALNTAFAANGLGLIASTAGGEVTLTQGAWGSAAGITVAYTAGGTLGNAPIAAGTYSNGLDVAGTINGEAATGSGQALTASTGTEAQGLAVRYTGNATGAAGDVTLNLGTGALVERMLRQYTSFSTGTLDTRRTSLASRITDLNDRADRIETKLAVRRESLLKQYAAMEQALGRLQSQSQSVLAVFNALTSNSGK